MPESLDTWGSIGGGLMALAAAVLAFSRLGVWEAGTALLNGLRASQRQNSTDAPDLLAALDHERQNRRADIEQVREALDAIQDRTKALEQVLSAHLTRAAEAKDLAHLNHEMHTIADRLGADVSNLRDLILELLRRAK